MKCPACYRLELVQDLKVELTTVLEKPAARSISRFLGKKGHQVPALRGKQSSMEAELDTDRVHPSRMTIRSLSSKSVLDHA